MPDEKKSSPPMLPYASSQTDAGVLFHRDEKGATVVIRSRGRPLAILGQIVASVLIFVVPVAVFWFGSIRAPLMRMGTANIAFAACALVLFFTAGAIVCRGATRPIIIELSSSELRFRNLDHEGHNRTIPRDKVYEVKCSDIGHELIVHARGHDMFLSKPITDPQQLEQIAAFLRESLGLPNPTDSAASAEPADPANSART